MNWIAIILPFIMELFAGLDCLTDSDTSITRRIRRKVPLFYAVTRVALRKKTKLRGRALRDAVDEIVDGIDDMSDNEITAGICEARRIKAKREAE